MGVVNFDSEVMNPLGSYDLHNILPVIPVARFQYVLRPHPHKYTVQIETRVSKACILIPVVRDGPVDVCVDMGPQVAISVGSRY